MARLFMLDMPLHTGNIYFGVFEQSDLLPSAQVQNKIVIICPVRPNIMKLKGVYRLMIIYSSLIRVAG